MSSIIAIAMLSCASAQVARTAPGRYKQSVYIGTPCECNASIVSHAHIYDLSYSADDDTGLCKGESVDPLDVWNGRGVEFYGYGDQHGTFVYQIDCALPCSISEAHVTGSGWSTLLTGGQTTALGITGVCGYTLKLATICLADGSCCAHCPDVLDTFSSTTYADVSFNANTGCPSVPSPLRQQFFIYEYDDVEIEAWRCRNSLSIVAATSMDGPFESSVLARKPITTDSSTSSEDSSGQPTTCHNDEECDDGQICDESECVNSSGDSKDSSSSDSKDSSSSESKDSSSSDSKDSSSSESKDSSSSESKDSSNSESKDSSSSESKDSSSSESKDSSSSDSKESSSSDSSDNSGLAACEALPVNAVLSKCSESMVCEARLRECEARQDLFLSMTGDSKDSSSSDSKDSSSGDESSGEEKVAPLSAPAAFGAEEALIGVLVVVNAVLFAYACKSNVAKNKPVYGGVHGSEQEDLSS